MAIGKARFQPPQRPTGKQLRINEQIRLSPIRLIDDNDQQVGIIELDDAKRRAREVGLDLVEVSPMSRPPVCKIMDYGKWKYQQKKKEQKARSHSKQSELKEVRLRPKIDDHDLGIKIEKAREFLSEGDKVQFTMLFRGREASHRDLAMQMMVEMRDKLASVSKVEAEPKFMGKRMTMVLAPDRKPKAPQASGAPGNSSSASSGGSPASGGLNIPSSVVNAPRPASAPAQGSTSVAPSQG